MAVGQAAAIGIDRQTSARRDGAVLHEGAALALGAEAQVFQEQDRGDGEGVVQVQHVHIRRSQPRLSERQGPRLGGRGHRQMRHVGDRAVTERLAHAQHIDRLLRQIARAPR